MSLPASPPYEVPLSRYVRWRMRVRGVTEEAIAHVVQYYDVRRPAQPRRGAPPAEVLEGAWLGRRLKVYVEQGTQPPRVKTVVWEGPE